ncbi:MAG: hypothetical protein RL616_319 [Verrucomicrobiota bacterium]|jgi:hypothetical protein
MIKTFLLIIGLSFAAGVGRAAETVFQLSLVPDVAIFPRTTQVNGLSLGIWNENPQASLELGFVNGNTGNSCGVSLGLVNYAENYRGVQWGAVNYCERDFTGVQDAYVNVCTGHFTGVQYGYVNYADDFCGLQLGAVNYTRHLRGVQLGFINVALNNPWFKEFPNKLATGFPFFNWSF